MKKLILVGLVVFNPLLGFVEDWGWPKIALVSAGTVAIGVYAKMVSSCRTAKWEGELPQGVNEVCLLVPKENVHWQSVEQKKIEITRIFPWKTALLLPHIALEVRKDQGKLIVDNSLNSFSMKGTKLIIRGSMPPIIKYSPN